MAGGNEFFLSISKSWMMRHILDLAVVLLHAMLLQRQNVKVPFLEKKKCSNSGAYINNICKKI